jgi:hypothetical protein
MKQKGRHRLLDGVRGAVGLMHYLHLVRIDTAGSRFWRASKIAEGVS